MSEFEVPQPYTPIDEVHLEQHRSSIGVNFRRWVAPLVCVAALGAVGGDTTPLDASADYAPGTEHIVNTDDPCIEPTPQESKTVEQLFTGPDNPTLKLLRNKHNQGPTAISAFEQRQEVAINHGLTLFNPENFLANLYGPERLSKTDSLHTSFGLAQEYFKQFGINLRWPETDEKFEYSGRPFDQKEIESGEPETAIRSLMKTFSKVPLELVNYTGLKNIVFASFADGKVNGYTHMDGKHDTIYIGMLVTWHEQDRYNIGTHELWHLVDRAMCGDQNEQADKTFLSINGGDIYHGDHRGYISQDAYYGEDGVVTAEMSAEKDPAKHEAIRKQLFANMATVSQYALDGDFLGDKAHEREDKAELGKTLLDTPDSRLQLYKESPILWQKTLLLYGRLYHALPDVARYLAETSYHATHNS